MSGNPFMSRLGFGEDDRVVITHADDVGMCQASVQAYEELFNFGTLTSGAVMVPCPWFPAAAELQKRVPGADLGVHLVLTSEWQLYRWRPVTAGGSLLDAEGFFPRSDAEIQEQGDPEEVESELNAQIERALAFGLDPTHADMHMGAVASPRFIPGYIRLITRHRLPPLIPRADEKTYRSFGVDAETYQMVAALTEYLDGQGIPMVDAAVGLPLDDPRDQLETARRMLGELKPGLTHFLLHPSVDTPELRAITPDWECRVANYKTFLSEAFRKRLEEEGVKLISYRRVRDAMRG